MLEAFYIRVLNAGKPGFDESQALAGILADVCRDFDITLKDATDYKSVATISSEITDALDRADVIFADGNSSNENVWYEIGYADRIQVRKVICLSRDGRALPFDRAAIRSIRYANPDNPQLKRELRAALESIICDVHVRGLIEARLKHDEFTRQIRNQLDTDRLRKIAAPWLMKYCRDTKTDVEDRRWSVRALAAIDALVENLSVLTDRFLDSLVREAVYDEIGKLRLALPAVVWDVTPDDLANDQLLRTFGKAAVRHWVDGNLADAWFRERVAKAGDERLRSVLLSELYVQTKSLAPPTA